MEPAWYDLAMAAILVVAFVRGGSHGALGQLAGIAALVIALVLAQPVSAAMASRVGLDPSLGFWVALVALYLLASLVCFWTARAARGWMERAGLLEFDRHVGALLGLLKGLVFCLAVTLAAAAFSGPLRDPVRNSYSGRIAVAILDRIEPVLPARLRDALPSGLRRPDAPDDGPDERRRIPLPNAPGARRSVPGAPSRSVDFRPAVGPNVEGQSGGRAWPLSNVRRCQNTA